MEFQKYIISLTNIIKLNILKLTFASLIAQNHVLWQEPEPKAISWLRTLILFEIESLLILAIF